MHRNQQEVRDYRYGTCMKKQNNRQVPKKSMGMKIVGWFLLSEYRKEKEPLQQGHLYGNGILMQRSADREDLQMFAHLYGLPAGRAEIFSVLRKTKKAEEKILQHIPV